MAVLLQDWGIVWHVGCTGDEAEKMIKGVYRVKWPLNRVNVGFTSCLAWFGALEGRNIPHEMSKNLGATRVLLSQVQQQWLEESGDFKFRRVALIHEGLRWDDMRRETNSSWCSFSLDEIGIDAQRSNGSNLVPSRRLPIHINNPLGIN